MKRIFLISILISCQLLSGQILCIKCFDQNDSISSNVHNLIKNGGFEESTCPPDSNFSFCPNSRFYRCDIQDWKCTGGGINTFSTIFDSILSIIPEGKSSVYFGNLLAKSCSENYSDTHCLKKMSCIVLGIPTGYPISEKYFGGFNGVSLEQTVSELIPGNIYVLEFWSGGAELGYRDNGLFALDIGFGNTFLRCKPTYAFSSDKGTTYIIQFKATSSSHIIKFTNWGHICSNCTELVLDNVRLYTLAELSSSVTSCLTATNNLNEDISFQLYPNPFSNDLHVKSNDFDQKEIILFDITSRKLIQQCFTNSISLNTEDLANGIYFYEVKNKNGLIKNGKVLKE